MMTVESDFGGSSLYHALGIDAIPPEEALSGRMALRASEALSGTVFASLTSEFLADYRVEKYLRNSETISTLYNQWMLSFPECTDMREMIETHLHHGWVHFRRVLKYFNEEFARSPNMRTNWENIRFAPAAYLAIRHHDLPEMYTNQKEHHDGAGALFAYGMLGLAYEKINEILLDIGSVDFLSRDEWEKQRAAATFICQHHSKPEKMPSTEELIKRGGVLFKATTLLEEASLMANEARTNLFGMFPGFKIMESCIKSIENQTEPSVQFSRAEIDAIREMTFAMAYADKMDSNKPPELSAARTFLVRPQRPLFVRVPGSRQMTLEEELAMRLENGRGNESTDDLSRFLFELMREPNWGNLPDGLKYDFMKGLFEKGAFMMNAIPKVVKGDFSLFRAAYDDIRKNTVIATLLKSGVGQKELDRVFRIRDVDWLKDEAVRLLRQHGFRGDDALFDILFAIQFEESNVISALVTKHELIQAQNLSSFEINRMQDLMRHVYLWQAETLRKYVGPISSEPRWWKDGYYYIPLEKYKITR